MLKHQKLEGTSGVLKKGKSKRASLAKVQAEEV